MFAYCRKAIQREINKLQTDTSRKGGETWEREGWLVNKYSCMNWTKACQKPRRQNLERQKPQWENPQTTKATSGAFVAAQNGTISPSLTICFANRKDIIREKKNYIFDLNYLRNLHDKNYDFLTKQYAQNTAKKCPWIFKLYISFKKSLETWKQVDTFFEQLLLS